MDDMRLGLLKQEAAPLRKKIIKSLRRAIETGQLAPGMRLIERDLCEQLGVSRTSLREALRQLQADGVLTEDRNRGLTVVEISIAEAKNIYSIRGVLEPLIIDQFITNAGDEEIASLAAQGEVLMAAYQRGKAEEIVSVKRDFYDILCTGAKNQIAFELLNKLTLLTSPLRRYSVSVPIRQVQSVDEIRDLVEAIRRRDRDAAREAIQRHLANAWASGLSQAEAAAGGA